MSLYGLNSYSSNNTYSTLLSAKNSSAKSLLSNNSSSKSTSSNSLFNSMKGIANTDSSSDLQTLAKNIDLVRSKGFQKKMTEEYRKVFAGDSSAAKSSSAEETLSKSAKSLNSSASAFVSGSTDVKGNSTDTVDNIKDFVSSYNSTIDGLKGTESISALSKGVSMASTTAAYSKVLDKIGITVGSDNKLSLDESKFSKADDSLKKSILSGRYSYASKTAEKANQIDKAAQIQSKSIYNNSGKVNSAALQNAMIETMYSKLF